MSELKCGTKVEIQKGKHKGQPRGVWKYELKLCLLRIGMKVLYC